MIVQLFAQPYDCDATGFYFETYEEYQEKAEKNVNRLGQKVEEYEFQFVDGSEWSHGQTALDAMKLETFLNIANTWDADKIKILEIVLHFEGAQAISHLDDESEIEDYVDECIIRVEDDEDSLYYSILEDYYPDLMKQLESMNCLCYFDYKSFLQDNMNSSSFERLDGIGWVYFENTR